MTVNRKRELVFPIRGVSGGWRDVGDDPDDNAQLRVRAEVTDRRQVDQFELLIVAMRHEALEARWQRVRERRS